MREDVKDQDAGLLGSTAGANPSGPTPRRDAIADKANWIALHAHKFHVSELAKRIEAALRAVASAEHVCLHCGQTIKTFRCVKHHYVNPDVAPSKRPTWCHGSGANADADQMLADDEAQDVATTRSCTTKQPQKEEPR